MAVADESRAGGRREAILDAAIELFFERGFHATGMGDIGRAAGITGSGIYRHFENKDAVLDAALRRGVTQIMGRAHEVMRGGGDPSDTLRRLVQAYLEEVLDSPALAAVVLGARRVSSPHTPAWFQRADRLFLAEWAHVITQIRPELSEVDVHLLVTATMGLLASAIIYPSGQDRDGLEKVLTNMAMRILVPPGVD